MILLHVKDIWSHQSSESSSRCHGVVCPFLMIQHSLMLGRRLERSSTSVKVGLKQTVAENQKIWSKVGHFYQRNAKCCNLPFLREAVCQECGAVSVTWRHSVWGETLCTLVRACLDG